MRPVLAVQRLRAGGARRRQLRHVRPRGCDGPDCADFPKGLAEAPVTWEYHGSELPLKFRAGFVGAMQDPETKTVSPRVGWFIVRQE